MKLSIVMPSRNQGRFIERALNSVLRQHRDDNLELIVRDCLSDDTTQSVLDRYEHPFIKVRRERDAGQSDAIVKGFMEASGEILSWLNSDDLLAAGAVERVMKTFHDHPDADIVFGDALYIDADDNVIGAFPVSTPSLRHLKDRCVLSQPSVFFRRDAYHSVQGVNPLRTYCMDYELWVKFALNRKRFVRADGVLSYTRIHSGTKTATGGIRFVDEICRMQREVLGSVSPVWQLYRMSRSPTLARVDNKLVRFTAATLHTVWLQPSAMPHLGRAALDRLLAEVGARMRSRPRYAR